MSSITRNSKDKISFNLKAGMKLNEINNQTGEYVVVMNNQRFSLCDKNGEEIGRFLLDN